MANYRDLKTNEIILEDEAEEYMFKKLGVVPTGEFNAEIAKERAEILDCFYSGNYVKVSDEEIRRVSGL